ncbi:SDR family NAD(P)-dependent oxidoreductase [Polymorphum gilvum]|uniref:Short-chain dehydrogenase/reductase SDR n=1 Tax=Polymorphum gilvum (strain LMG 25793 / CGMCC 1.9160 / SL003B-26A1) TaxID=991905 RepID=F2IXG5_POLGS|nr:SDR family oxidoreductase [Polymorphum gilvum]ADZ71588.1 Short-chain dehydrogenase/reductase SDR [Polymorphum gilvum SL003B-26A1]
MPTVVVTGAGSGIGQATALRFAQAGWNVVAGLYDASQETGTKAVHGFAEASGGSCHTVIADISKEVDAERLIEEAARQFASVDALVNAAGITRMVPLADLATLTPEMFHAIYAVNTVGAFLTARAAAPHLRKAQGAIVNVSSLAARTGGGSSIAYAASKAALETVTLSLARVLAPQVRVNAVAPALVADGFVQRLDPRAFEERKRGQVERAPLARIGRPDDVAETIFWLATGAPLVTGEIVTLDCGLHLNAD